MSSQLLDAEIASLKQRMLVMKQPLAKVVPEEVLSLRRPERVESLMGHVDYPVGIIAGDRPYGVPVLSRRIMPGPHDGAVSVASTHLTGETDHIVLPVSHSGMIWNDGVKAQVLQFLQHGSFERTETNI